MTRSLPTPLYPALHENDPEAALLWTEKLHWLTETDEQDIDSARQREIRRDAVEILRELDIDSDDSHSQELR